MSTAPDFYWAFGLPPLFAAVGLFLPLAYTAARGPVQAPHERAQLLALALAAGLLTSLLLGLLLPDLRQALRAQGALAAAGLLGLAWAAWRRPGWAASLLGMGRLRWAVLGGGLALLASAILFQPLHAWDARSIWFFQGKRIYFDGGLDLSRDWTNLLYIFMHADYPKLLPLLAAQTARLFGVWNDYIPKASLLLLLAASLLGVAGLAHRSRASLAFLLVAMLLPGREHLWNGYTDAYLSAFAGLGLVYLARWFGQGRLLDAACALLYLALALNLKNEGTLLVACTVAGAAAMAWLRRGPGAPALLPRERGAQGWLLLVLALAAAGWLTWAAMKSAWAVHNDLDLGLGALPRILARLGNSEWLQVAKALLLHCGAGAVAVGLARLLAHSRREPVPITAWLPAGVATLYLAGIVAIYLATPYDLQWHLFTSANRVLQVVLAGYFATAWLILEAGADNTQGKYA